MKSVYLSRHDMNINFTENLGMDKKIMELIVKDNENETIYIIPIIENNFKYIKAYLDLFEKWIEKDEKPKTAKIEKEIEHSYIG